MGSANHTGKSIQDFIDGMCSYYLTHGSTFGHGAAAMAEIEARTILGQKTDLSDLGSVCKAIIEVAGKPNIPSDQTGVYGFLREYAEFLLKNSQTTAGYVNPLYPAPQTNEAHR